MQHVETASEQTPLPLSEFLPRERYCETRKHVFPSATSFNWFLRQNREELIREGALLLIGRSFKVHASNFDRCVMAIGRRQAGSRATQ